MDLAKSGNVKQSLHDLTLDAWLVDRARRVHPNVPAVDGNQVLWEPRVAQLLPDGRRQLGLDRGGRGPLRRHPQQDEQGQTRK